MTNQCFAKVKHCGVSRDDEYLFVKSGKLLYELFIISFFVNMICRETGILDAEMHVGCAVTELDTDAIPAAFI